MPEITHEQLAQKLDHLGDQVLAAVGSASRAESLARAALKDVAEFREQSLAERRDLRDQISAVGKVIGTADARWSEELRDLRRTIRTEVHDALLEYGPGGRVERIRRAMLVVGLLTLLGVGGLAALVAVMISSMQHYPAIFPW